MANRNQTDETTEATTKKKKRRKKARPEISTKGFGPQIASHDRYALAAATKITVTRLTDGEGQIKAALNQSKDDESPWSGSAELWRDIETGWHGDAGKFSQDNANGSRVLQSIWKRIGEADMVSMGNVGGLFTVRILNKGQKSMTEYILGRATTKK